VRAYRKAKVERRNVRSKYNVAQLYEILPLENAKAQLSEGCANEWHEGRSYAEK